MIERDEVLSGEVAVLFCSTFCGDPLAYAADSATMVAMAEAHPGYLGHRSVRQENGQGITVSWWRDAEAAAAFGAEVAHRLIQRRGRERYYADYLLEVAEVRRRVRFTREGA